MYEATVVVKVITAMQEECTKGRVLDSFSKAGITYPMDLRNKIAKSYFGPTLIAEEEIENVLNHGEELVEIFWNKGNVTSDDLEKFKVGDVARDGRLKANFDDQGVTHWWATIITHAEVRRRHSTIRLRIDSKEGENAKRIKKQKNDDEEEVLQVKNEHKMRDELLKKEKAEEKVKLQDNKKAISEAKKKAKEVAREEAKKTIAVKKDSSLVAKLAKLKMKLELSKKKICELKQGSQKLKKVKLSAKSTSRIVKT